LAGLRAAAGVPRSARMGNLRWARRGGKLPHDEQVAGQIQRDGEADRSGRHAFSGLLVVQLELWRITPSSRPSGPIPRSAGTMTAVFKRSRAPLASTPTGK